MPSHQTDDQRLGFLRDYYAQHGIFPSYQRLAKLLGYRSPSAAAAAMKRLMQGGYLGTGEGGRLSPGQRFFERPLAVGKVPAGPPIDSEDLGVTLAQIDGLLVRHPSRTFILKIEGNSMTGVGLLDGDYVIAERDSHCEEGDVVVASVDGRYTVKLLAKERGQYYLKAANPEHGDIWPKGRLEIAGLVVGSFRKMH